ncbi:MAG: 2-isopropylmalate synthase [Myxococcales bacterium]|nr:2-isopropylmalate synthase [Myxococcales bacterium]
MRERVELNDETLRDGLQSPSIHQPSLQDKMAAVRLMAELGLNAVSLGLPASNDAQARDVTELLERIATERLPLQPHCAARTKVEDLRPVVEIVQKVGIELEVYAFLGTSPIRCFTEGWSLDDLLRHLECAVAFAHRHQLRLAFVTEDTTRSRPEDLARLFGHAIDLGVRRLVLCDTVGYTTPVGAANIVRFVRNLVTQKGESVALDWHGHNDRGLAVACSLAAEAAGADRIHGTMLGMGERCGNAPIDQLLQHRWAKAPARHPQHAALNAYRELVEEACGWRVSSAYPWPMFNSTDRCCRLQSEETMADLMPTGF